MSSTQAPESPIRTRHTRVAEDLADKLGEILEVEGGTSAAFLDPLIRTEIENRHRANAKAIKAMREARELAAKLRDEPPVMTNDLGGES
jgi:hypothetical protein